MATLKDIAALDRFTTISLSENADRKIGSPFCCDLLSIAMGKAHSDCCWVTVMANVNTLAVASLADVSCITLAEGVAADEAFINKANEQGITVFSTDLPVFEASLALYHLNE